MTIQIIEYNIFFYNGNIDYLQERDFMRCKKYMLPQIYKIYKITRKIRLDNVLEEYTKTLIYIREKSALA